MKHLFHESIQSTLHNDEREQQQSNLIFTLRVECDFEFAVPLRNCLYSACGSDFAPSWLAALRSLISAVTSKLARRASRDLARLALLGMGIPTVLNNLVPLTRPGFEAMLLYFNSHPPSLLVLQFHLPT